MKSKKIQRSSGGRNLTVTLKKARGRTTSSQRWLQRQLNDPYVQKAKELGYRSRAAFKLIDIDHKYKILRPGATIIDLGAAPGGWTQVACQQVKTATGQGTVIGLDLSFIEDIPGAHLIEMDFFHPDAGQRILELLPSGRADVVLSDMAAPATGHPQTDHLRIMALAEAAFDLAKDILTDDGIYLAKVLRGGTEASLLTLLKRHFKSVRHVKPASSRADSSEMYVLAIGFKR